METMTPKQKKARAEETEGGEAHRRPSLELHTSAGDVFAAFCKVRKRWGIYLAWDRVMPNTGTDSRGVDYVTQEYAEVRKSLRPPLAHHPDLECALVLGGMTVLLFETEQEMLQTYRAIDGNDTGGSIYALTCSPEGTLLNENT